MLDVFSFGVSEAPVLCGAGGDVVSTGITLFHNPQYGGLGISVVLSGAIDGNFDLVIETAVQAAAPGQPGSWSETSDRINGVNALGSVSIPCANPVLDKCRVKIVKNAGTVDTTFGITWLADKQPTLN